MSEDAFLVGGGKLVVGEVFRAEQAICKVSANIQPRRGTMDKHSGDGNDSGCGFSCFADRMGRLGLGRVIRERYQGSILDLEN